MKTLKAVVIVTILAVGLMTAISMPAQAGPLGVGDCISGSGYVSCVVSVSIISTSPFATCALVLWETYVAGESWPSYSRSIICW